MKDQDPDVKEHGKKPTPTDPPLSDWPPPPFIEPPKPPTGPVVPPPQDVEPEA